MLDQNAAEGLADEVVECIYWGNLGGYLPALLDAITVPSFGIMPDELSCRVQTDWRELGTCRLLSEFAIRAQTAPKICVPLDSLKSWQAITRERPLLTRLRDLDLSQTFQLEISVLQNRTDPRLPFVVAIDSLRATVAALRIDGTSELTFADFVKQLQATTIIPVDALHLARDHFDEALAAVHEVRSGKLHENSLKEMERIVAGSCKQLFSNQFRILTDWLCRLLLHSLPRWENED
jgi:hypothetical protein